MKTNTPKRFRFTFLILKIWLSARRPYRFFYEGFIGADIMVATFIVKFT